MNNTFLPTSYDVTVFINKVRSFKKFCRDKKVTDVKEWHREDMVVKYTLKTNDVNFISLLKLKKDIVFIIEKTYSN